jgi:hypothetical protein
MPAVWRQLAALFWNVQYSLRDLSSPPVTVREGRFTLRPVHLAWQDKQPLVSRAWSMALCLACLNLLYVAIVFNLVGPGLDY